MDVGEQLRTELKSWERSFKAKHGREPTKQDIKLVPDIAEKYKLYRARTKASSQSSTQASQKDPNKDTRRKNVVDNRDSRTPSTPDNHRATATSDQRKSYILPKSKPAVSAVPSSTSNPFSPIKRSQETAIAKQSAASTSSVTTANEDSIRNPFLSPAKSKRVRRASGLFTEHAVDHASPPSSIKLITKPFPSASISPQKSYDFAPSPRKLRSLISSSSSVARDTPRTKARKRMRGEDVPATPSEKRRRISPVLEAEDIPETPVRATKVKGHAFKPIFKDDDNVRGPLFGAPRNQYGSSMTAVDHSASDFPGEQKRSQKDKWGQNIPQSSHEGSKRPLPSDSENQNDRSIMFNPLCLRPPSPPPVTASTSTSTSSKNKGNWPGRKKVKLDGRTGRGSGDEDESGSEEASDPVELRTWRVWGPPRADKLINEGYADGKDAEDVLAVYRSTATDMLPDVAESADLVEISLSEDLRQLLAISTQPSSSRESEVLKRLLGSAAVGEGDGANAGISKDVWGAGEWNGDEWEWESEPEGWDGEIDI